MNHNDHAYVHVYKLHSTWIGFEDGWIVLL